MSEEVGDSVRVVDRILPLAPERAFEMRHNHSALALSGQRCEAQGSEILLPLRGIRISPFDSALTRVISRAGSVGSDAHTTAQLRPPRQSSRS